MRLFCFNTANKLLNKMFPIYNTLLIITFFIHSAIGECGVIAKHEWGGLNCTRLQYLPRPVDLVIVQETGTDFCKADEKCETIMRTIQTLHMERHNWPDIAYSFAIGGNGRVYEGSGWLRVGKHTEAYNNRTVGIAFIGIFNDEKPKRKAIDALKLFLKCGMKRGHLTPNYQLVAQKQLIDSDNPNKKLYKKIKNLSHWVDDLDNVRQKN